MIDQHGPAPVDRTDGQLDAAVLAHRANPNPITRARVLATQADHAHAFMTDQTTDYQARTHGLRGTV